MCNQCYRNSGVLKEFFVNADFFTITKKSAQGFLPYLKSSGSVLWLNTLVPLKYFERCSQVNKLIAPLGIRDTINNIILY